MSIWHAPVALDEVRKTRRNTLVEHLGIELSEVGPDFLRGSMAVDHRTIQPSGQLHGGASVALAETLGSIAANLCVDPKTRACVGQEINANHLRPVFTGGRVTGTARPVHLGSRSQVWQIEIRDEADRLTCISRLTIAVVERPS